MVTIKFWGVRGSTPCANSENMGFGGNTTCVQICSPDLHELLILDCGTGIRNLGNQLIDHEDSLTGNIFLTHPHWDHLQGFAFFKPFYHPKGKFKVHLPPQEGMSCNDILQGHFSNTFFPVTLDMLSAELSCSSIEQGAHSFEGYQVNMIWGRHTIPTGIFKITIDGKTIVFAPDNELPHDDSDESLAYIEEFKSFVHGVDVLIHDAQYNYEEYQSRQGWGHSNWEKVLEVIRESQIKQVYFTHHDPDHSDEYLKQRSDQIHEMAGTYNQVVELARDGMTVKIS